MTSTYRHLLPGVLALSTWMVATGSHAAPAIADEAAPAKATSEAPAVTAPPTPGGGTNSRTVDLLLQLQDQQQQPTLNPGGAKGAAEVPRAGATKIVVATEESASGAMGTLKAAVLGTQFLRGGDAQETNTRPLRAAERMDGAAADGKPSSEGRSSILMNPVVRFIRENRGLTAVICVLVLAAVWATASFSMRRSR